jgi:hypothetical protein
VGEPDHGSVAVGFQLVSTPCRCNQRRRSVKNLKTVSGDALTLNRRHFEPLTISGLTAAAAFASARSASA